MLYNNGNMIQNNPPTRYAHISGVGAYRPESVVPNRDIIAAIDSSEEWIEQRSGIRERRRAGKHETLVVMGAAATYAALEHAGLAPDELDMVLVASMTHLEQIPLAPGLAAEIGSRAAALDIGAACAGYIYGIGVADGLVRSGQAQHVAVVGTERMLDYTSPVDRSTAFIFGDGAGAAIVSPSDEPGIGQTIWSSNGTLRHVIRQSCAWPTVHEPPSVEKTAIQMDGTSVFRWAIRDVPPVASQAISAAGLSPEKIDVLIPHQANIRIIDAIAKALGMSEKTVADDIRVMANTSAASIPLATEALLSSGRAQSGDLALQVGFGAGLTCAAQVVRLP